MWMESHPIPNLKTRRIIYSEVDRELKIPQGKTEQYIELIAIEFGYKILYEFKSKTSITLRNQRSGWEPFI